MDNHTVSIKIMENGLENVAIDGRNSGDSNSDNRNNNNNLEHVAIARKNSNGNNGNTLSLKSSKKRRKSASMLEVDSNYLGVDYKNGHDEGSVSGSDTSRSPSTPPATHKVFKSKKGWAKIKRELITKERKDKSPEKEESHGILLTTSTATTEMSPMNSQKSPVLSRRYADTNNNNNNTHYANSNMLGNNFLLVEKKKTMKLLVLGQDGVGKSALIVRYLTRRYIGEYDPLLEGVFRKSIILGNQEILVEIKDTAKGINWSKRKNDLLWTDAIVMMYSITNRSSFLEVQGYAKQIQHELKTRGIPCLIIGNKTDLAHVRKVDTVEGSKLANSVQSVFHEISVSDHYLELEQVLDSFIKDHCHGLKYPTSSIYKQSKMLSSRSSPEITREKSRDSTDGEIESVKSERKGRALWQKLRTNSELKKKK